MAEHKWFEDWEIAVKGYDDGMAQIEINLPHNQPHQFTIWTTKEQMQLLANFVDKALSQLTGTKTKGVIDGDSVARTPGRLATPGQD